MCVLCAYRRKRILLDKFGTLSAELEKIQVCGVYVVCVYCVFIDVRGCCCTSLGR